jgi:flagellar biosynthesis/type III secretory pathway protein FliH
MSEQSTALRLAEALRNIAADTSLSDRYCEVMSEADDELRRLHALNGELLEALKLAQSIIGHPDDAHSKFIAAAIARAEKKV